MIIREFQGSDLEEIIRLHRDSGLQYDFAYEPYSEFFSRRIVSDGDGIGMAAFLRKSAEAFLIVNPKWRTPAWRMEALKQLHEVCRGDCRNNGIREVNAFLAPEMIKAFGRRLERMGWSKYIGSEWRAYSIEV